MNWLTGKTYEICVHLSSYIDVAQYYQEYTEYLITWNGCTDETCVIYGKFSIQIGSISYRSVKICLRSNKKTQREKLDQLRGFAASTTCKWKVGCLFWCATFVHLRPNYSGFGVGNYGAANHIDVKIENTTWIMYYRRLICVHWCKL